VLDILYTVWYKVKEANTGRYLPIVTLSGREGPSPPPKDTVGWLFSSSDLVGLDYE